MFNRFVYVNTSSSLSIKVCKRWRSFVSLLLSQSESSGRYQLTSANGTTRGWLLAVGAIVGNTKRSSNDNFWPSFWSMGSHPLSCFTVCGQASKRMSKTSPEGRTARRYTCFWYKASQYASATRSLSCSFQPLKVLSSLLYRLDRLESSANGQLINAGNFGARVCGSGSAQ